MIKCIKYPIKSIDSEYSPGYWQLLISMCTGQYKIKSQCTKHSLWSLQQQDMQVNAWLVARGDRTKIAKGNQHRQSIATATQTQANQSTYNNARGRGGQGFIGH